MNIRRFGILGLCIGVLSGCGGAEQQTLLVEHYLVPCEGLAPQLCLLVSEPPSTEQELLFDSIDGFDFEWGERAEIVVEVTEIADPPADGSSLRYELIEVTSDETVSERFSIRLRAAFVVGDPSTGTFSLLGQREVTCAEQSVCDDIADALQVAMVDIELAHGADATAPLIAHSAALIAP